MWHPGSPNENTIIDVFNSFGPIPRVCLEMASKHSEIELYDNQLQNDVDRLSLDKLKEMVYLLQSFNMEETLHKLCLIMHATTAIKPRFCVAPITRYVRCRLSISMRNLNRHELVKAFKRLHNLSSGQAMSGVIFENICHQDFANQIHIKLFPMVQLPSESETLKNKSYWFSSHELPSDDTHDSGKNKFHMSEKLSQKAQDARNHCIILKIDKSAASNVNHYGNEKLAFKLGIYYVPDKPNEVTFDSFLLLRGVLYIFQFTVSEEHTSVNWQNNFRVSGSFRWFLSFQKPKPENSYYVYNY